MGNFVEFDFIVVFSCHSEGLFDYYSELPERVSEFDPVVLLQGSYYLNSR